MAISLVQVPVVGASGSGTASRGITFGSTTLAGSTLVLMCASGTQNTPTAVSDSGGNTWVRVTGSSDKSATGNRLSNIYVCVNANPTNTITFTSASSVALMGTIYELANVGGVRWADSSFNSGTVSCTGTAGNGDAILGCMAWTGGNTTATISNPSNGDTYTNQSQGTIGTVYFATAYVLGTTAGTRGPKFTSPGAVSFGISAVCLYETVPAATSVAIAVTSNPGGWTNVGGAATFMAALSDSNDATYLASDTATANPSKLRMRHASLVPLTTGLLTVRLRKSDSGSGTCKVRLYEGATLRKEWTQAVTTAWVDYSLSLTSGELATITSFANLDIEYEWGV